MTDQVIPTVLNIPVGLSATGMRMEFDSIGQIEVPANHYWGAQVQRALLHFVVGRNHMPIEIFWAYGYIKKAAAIVNAQVGRLPEWKSKLIQQVADEIIAGKLDSEFPLYVWQTGSGTQSNMNVNEVISNRCIQLVGGQLGSQNPIHPNNDVNMGQSSNDTFVTVMHLASYKMTIEKTIPALKALRDSLDTKAKLWADIVKIGRTHLEDATPITVGQEWSGYVSALDDALVELSRATENLLQIALGGTAVGTGLNASVGFSEQAAKALGQLTGYNIQTASNKFAAQATLDRMVRAHAALKTTAVTLFKIANDMRWLGSGPRTGLMEIIFPSNEPGSSIMPGKVNPTQAEVLLMVCIQIMGSDAAVHMGGAEGNFELNVFRPLVIAHYLDSALIMCDACNNFRTFMLEGAVLNTEQLQNNIDHSVMMVPALSPKIGYEKAAAITHDAIKNNLTLKAAALANGITEAMFDSIVVPIKLTQAGSADLTTLRNSV